MAGLALTDNFLIGSATVCLGSPADLKIMRPATHSIGLVKNFQINSEPAYTELTQGIKNTIVDSIMTSNPITCSMEAYEFTSKNLTYALGLNGASVTTNTVNSTVATGVTTSSTSLVLASATGFAEGDMIMIYANGIDDLIVRKIASISTDTLTLDLAVTDVPVGSVVRKINSIDIGSKLDQPYLAAKVIGKLSNGQGVVLELPKLRVSKGFNLNFDTSDYNNMPFEFMIYDLVSTDSFFSEFGSIPARLYRS